MHCDLRRKYELKTYAQNRLGTGHVVIRLTRAPVRRSLPIFTSHEGVKRE